MNPRCSGAINGVERAGQRFRVVAAVLAKRKDARLCNRRLWHAERIRDNVGNRLASGDRRTSHWNVKRVRVRTAAACVHTELEAD